MSETRFCSDASLDRDEPLHGTASTVQRWILVERNGPWGPKALSENRLGEEASARLRAIGKRAGARVLLVRKHGRYEQEGFRVMVAFTGRGSRWLEALRFETVEALLAHDFSALRRGRSVGGEPLRTPRFFVCTHGKHDPCCARKGRSIAHALNEAMSDATWETSHIGGDRFAGNVLALPAGIYYGRVEPAQAVRLMTQLREGRLDLRHYRGRSCYPFAAQAAEWLVRERMNLFGVDDLRLESHDAESPPVSRTVFRLRDGSRVAALVERSAAAPARLTCHAEREAEAPTHELRSLSEVLDEPTESAG